MRICAWRSRVAAEGARAAELQNSAVQAVPRVNVLPLWATMPIHALLKVPAHRCLNRRMISDQNIGYALILKENSRLVESRARGALSTDSLTYINVFKR